MVWTRRKFLAKKAEAGSQERDREENADSKRRGSFEFLEQNKISTERKTNISKEKLVGFVYVLLSVGKRKQNQRKLSAWTSKAFEFVVASL